jgi:catechol 2,3-dioxygenase-like lactoylglutathione lyase family enzyme
MAANSLSAGNLAGLPGRHGKRSGEGNRRKPMINHLSIGVHDIARAKRFYDAALKPLGYTCLSQSEDSLGYGTGDAAFWVVAAERPVAADEKSGLHICLDAPTRASVDAFHKAAVRSGGRDNGEPGLRPGYGANYYAAFVVDLDGYRIEAFCGRD